MKNKPLIIYLINITFLSAGFIVLIKIIGQKGNYFGAFYMMGPAIAAEWQVFKNYFDKMELVNHS
jgi:hypothetical protein